jgi:GH15 family glucan-1,4-alpha-glucosidase
MAEPLIHPNPDRDYQAIGEYGFISDCRSCGLVARDASIDWLCFRRFDASPVFGRLLDRKLGGYFQIAPKGASTVTRRYVPETNVLETTFRTKTGVLVVTDCLPVWDDERHPGHLAHQPPEDLLIRSVRCDEGEVEVLLECFPRFDYGLTTPFAYLIDPQLAQFFGGQSSLRLQSDLGPLELEGNAACRSQTKLRKGERREVALIWEAPHAATHQRVDRVDLRFRVERTIDFWQRWSSRCHYRGPHRDLVIRSMLALKGLTCDETGAVIAAATTSLPEEIGGVRNWDYRFSWLRDSVALLATLSKFGDLDDARRFGQYLLRTTAGRVDELQILYGIGGERLLQEFELKGLEGWRRSAPVRVGNGAFDQFQMDTYGELVGVTKALTERLLVGTPNDTPIPIKKYWMRFIKEIADTAARRWQEPDDGIWESRGGRRHFTFSKLMAWEALRDTIELLRDHPELDENQAELPKTLARWEKARDEIRQAIETQGVDPSTGAFTQYFGSTTLDATALLVLLRGFLPPDDPRVRATIEQVDKNLSVNGHVYRYLDRQDGLPGEEGSFAFCTLWLSKAFSVIGDIDRARDRLDRVLASVNDLGLLAEEIDPHTGEMLGNFPQAFSHIGLIDAIDSLRKAMSGQERVEPRLDMEIPIASTEANI